MFKSLQSRVIYRQTGVIFKKVLLHIWGSLQRLQPKILIFTFVASLLPIIFLLGIAWQFVNQPLIDLEKTRLDDQVLAFRGYTSATVKGLQNLSKSYAIWTGLYDAIEQGNQSWIKEEVTDQLVLSTDVDDVRVVNRFGETLGERGNLWQQATIQERVKALIADGKTRQELLAFSDRQLLLLLTAPVFRTDGSGNSPGTLIIGQTLNDAWLRNFLNFSQPTTQLDIISLTGQLMFSSSGNRSLDSWEEHHLTKEVLPAIQQGFPVYRLEPKLGQNKIYAPIISDNKPVAIVKIQISSEYFQNASVALTRAIWFGLGLATILSIAIANFLAKQIGKPINQLAKRSKTLAAGDLDSPIPGIYAGGEIGQLANAYQEMAQALKSLIDNLEQRVAERTQELELARHTLEERVQQRTKELSKKNQQLQKASEQLKRVNSALINQTEELNEALSNLKKTQAQLVQTEKMSSLGQLVAGIAHEINNPITFIYANLFHLNNYTQDLVNLVRLYEQHYVHPEIQTHIEEIELDYITFDLPKIISSMHVGAERISQIVKTLRNFSRFEEDGLKRFNLHEGIDSTLLILQNRLKMNREYPEIQVIKDYGDLPLVECYPRQMNQVFMNIISNAIDAIDEWFLKSHFSLTYSPKIAIKTEVLNSNKILVSIWNNGPAIPLEILDRIFDPFFTTKPVGKGTGLGLSVCYQIVQKHDGSIGVISEPDKGTEFAIALPINAYKHLTG